MPPTPTLVTDHDLEKLASDPARPLFPLLRSAAEAMFPLAVALAFLPVLYAVGIRPMTDAGALQGLESLRFLSLSRGMGASFANGLEQLDSLEFEPPLMRWLTALCLKVCGVGTDLGLLLAPLLCTAGLLLACYALGRRLGGEYLALLSVMCLAFHPLLLQGAQQPVPQSAAILFALLSFVGMVAHWQKSATVISYQGLLGGISLGLCLLAGGALSLAVVLILVLHVAVWKFEGHWRKTPTSIWDRGQFTRRTAYWSLAVMVVTAFALAGWHVMLLRTRDPGGFWGKWLMPPTAEPIRSVRGFLSFLASPAELSRVVFPFLGLTLIGLGTILRDHFAGGEEIGRRHRLILLPWIVVALLGCCFAAGPCQASESTVLLWETFLVVPLGIAAAVGMIEIAERRVRLEISLAAGLLALASLMTLWHSPAGTAEPVLGHPLVIGIFVMILGVGLLRLARTGEHRCRWVLSLMLLTILLLSVFQGGEIPRETGNSNRDLQQWRLSLANQAEVAELTFFGLPRPGVLEVPTPPARLIYSLVSQWPQARFRFARSWEEAAALPTPSEIPEPSGRMLVVTWSPRGMLRTPLPHPTLKLISQPLLFEDVEISVYQREALAASE
ncbi:MAG: glycosyltransferase family 39 protein [Planctomycetes bacterium]|nr:glycosyltransferase family 39 protein [Planctomycetota bacterium]